MPDTKDSKDQEFADAIAADNAGTVNADEETKSNEDSETDGSKTVTNDPEKDSSVSSDDNQDDGPDSEKVKKIRAERRVAEKEAKELKKELEGLKALMAKAGFVPATPDATKAAETVVDDTDHRVKMAEYKGFIAMNPGGSNPQRLMRDALFMTELAKLDSEDDIPALIEEFVGKADWLAADAPATRTVNPSVAAGENKSEPLTADEELLAALRKDGLAK